MQQICKNQKKLYVRSAVASRMLLISPFKSMLSNKARSSHRPGAACLWATTSLLLPSVSKVMTHCLPFLYFPAFNKPILPLTEPLCHCLSLSRRPSRYQAPRSPVRLRPLPHRRMDPPLSVNTDLPWRRFSGPTSPMRPLSHIILIHTCPPGSLQVPHCDRSPSGQDHLSLPVPSS